MNFGYNFETNEFISNKKEINAVEIEAVNNILDRLDLSNYDESQLKIEKKSKDYTSLTYRDIDVLRIKITDRVKWIIIPIEKNEKLPLDNLYDYNDKIINAIDWISKH